MSAIDILTRRLGITIEEAEPYIMMAEEKVRSYMKLNKLRNVDNTTLAFAVSDIAALFYQRDVSTQQASQTLGFGSMSYSEGGVSRSISGLSGSEIREQYETAINDVLDNLDWNTGKVVFL